MTEPIVFEHDEVQLRVDGGVLELFRRSNVVGSYRAPLSWVKVQSQARKRDRIMLHFSHVRHPDEPIYARLTGSVYSVATVEIPMTDEPLYRAFFTELAVLADRPIT